MRSLASKLLFRSDSTVLAAAQEAGPTRGQGVVLYHRALPDKVSAARLVAGHRRSSRDTLPGSAVRRERCASPRASTGGPVGAVGRPGVFEGGVEEHLRHLLEGGLLLQGEVQQEREPESLVRLPLRGGRGGARRGWRRCLWRVGAVCISGGERPRLTKSLDRGRHRGKPSEFQSGSTEKP